MAYDDYLEERQDELDLRDYVAIVRRRWPIIAGTFLALTLAALVFSLLQPKRYTSTAEVRINITALSDANSAQIGRNVERIIENELTAIRGDAVIADALEESGLEGTVSVSADSDTNETMSIRATSDSPANAAALANQMVESYENVRGQQIIAENQALADRSQARMDRLTEELENLDRNSVDYRSKEAALGQEARDREEFIRRTELATDGVANVNRVAVESSGPSSPKPLRNTLLAGVLGLLGGIGIAFLVDYFDDSIRDGEELGAATQGVPTLAVLPTLEARHAAEDIIALSSPDSRAVEAFRALRTSVLFLDVDGDKRAIMVTSPLQGDGKSTTIANLAVLLAKSGKKVALLDLDLRRPRLHNLFGITGDTGYTTVVTGQTPLRDAMVPISDAGTLWVLPAGPKPPNPSELLGSMRTAELIQRLRPQVDILLVDTAPVLPVTDARVVSPLVDGTILVVNADASRRAVKTAGELLRGHNLLGTVVNRADAGGPGGGAYGAYGYGYGYGYGYDDDTTSSTATPLERFKAKLKRKRKKSASTDYELEPASFNGNGNGSSARRNGEIDLDALAAKGKEAVKK